MLTLKDWLAALSMEERDELAALAGTSRGYLYLVANGHRLIGPDVAGRLADASEQLARVRDGTRAPLRRGDLAAVCRRCRYAQELEGRQ